MSQRRKNLRTLGRSSLITLALLVAIAPGVAVAQDRSFHDSHDATVGEPLSSEAGLTANLRTLQFEPINVLAAALCFAVGFVACLLLVHNMLPGLVHAQCIEIVREHLDFVRRESDIRVVILDRESREPLQKPRRASTPVADTSPESSYQLQQHLRVDRPAAPVGPADTHSAGAPNSMLSQIYEQNLQLRDQLREQSRSVQP